MKTVAIMQPTYLPWLGYFDLMDQVDVFVLLDSVQFEKRSWQQRNRIKTPNGALYLTIPVITKGLFHQRIQDVKIDRSKDFARLHLNTIIHNYSKAKYFSHYFPSIKTILTKNHHNLVGLTVELICWLKKSLKITTPLIRSSTLNPVGKKADLLLDICLKLNGTHYVSALGSKIYFKESDIFENHKIPIRYQNYHHPCYNQLHGEFIPYLSAVDLLFNEGDRSYQILKSTHKKPK